MSQICPHLARFNKKKFLELYKKNLQPCAKRISPDDYPKLIAICQLFICQMCNGYMLNEADKLLTDRISATAQQFKFNQNMVEVSKKEDKEGKEENDDESELKSNEDNNFDVLLD